MHLKVVPYLEDLQNQNWEVFLYGNGHLLKAIWYIDRNHNYALVARDSSPRFLVTPAQLMRTSIGQNTSCVVGDIVYHLGLPFLGRCSSLMVPPWAMYIL